MAAQLQHLPTSASIEKGSMKRLDPKARAQLMAIKLEEQRIRRVHLEIEELMLQFDGVYPKGFQDHYGTAKVTPFGLRSSHKERKILPDGEFLHHYGFYDDQPECISFKSPWFDHLGSGRNFLICKHWYGVDRWLWVTCTRGVVRLAELRGSFTLVNPSNGKGIMFLDTEEKIRAYELQL
jgi:hypothetical protein